MPKVHKKEVAMTSNEYKKTRSKEILRLTWPIFVETMLFMILGTVDTLMLSKYSDNAVAAVGVSNQIVWFINLIFAVITTGTAILCAQYRGAENKDGMSVVATISLIINGVLGIILSIVIVFNSRAVLNLLNVPADIMGYAADYLVIVGGAAFIQALITTIAAIIRSHGFTKVTMKITLVMNIINLLGNYVLIYGKFGFPAMGVRGSALATSVSRGVALIAAFIILIKYVDRNISIKKLKPFPYDVLKKLLKIGIPSAGEQISYNTSQLVITYFITMLGSEALATKSYVGNITMLTMVFSISIGQGTSILIGKEVGAKRYKEAYELALHTLKTALIISFFAALLCAIFGRALLSIFTSNMNIVELGAKLLIIDWILELGRVFNLVIINALRAAGDVKFPVYCGILSMWGVAVVVSYSLGIKLGLGLIGIWIAFTMDEWIRGILMIHRWKGKKWYKMTFV